MRRSHEHERDVDVDVDVKNGRGGWGYWILDTGYWRPRTQDHCATSDRKRPVSSVLAMAHSRV